MEIKNLGKIRGGGNDHARFFLHVIPGDGDEEVTKEELSALLSPWDEELGMEGYPWVGWCYPINTRREFSLVPYIIRKAQNVGWQVATSMWDTGIKGKVFADSIEFWQALSLAQTFFKE